MGRTILGLAVLWTTVAATGCKSSKDCPTCACDGGAAPTIPTAAVAPPVEPAVSGTAAATSPAVVGQPSVAKCVGAGCEESAAEPGDPGSGPPRDDPSATPPMPPVLVAPVAPVLPADVPAAGPLAPGLAAHLTRLPSEGELVVVGQVDLRALLSPADVRLALGGLLELLRGEVQGDPACLAELAASIELLTVEAVEFADGNDTAVAIVEGGIDLPGILECAATLMPDEVPRELLAQAARGYVELDDDFALATLGPRTVAFGGPELLRPIRAGRAARPVSASAEFEAARRALGAGPAYFVVLAHDGDRGRNDESFTGGAVLRTSPRLGATGSFTFAVSEMVGEVVGEFTEMLTELDEEQAEVLGALRGMPGGTTIAGDASKLFDAVRQARLTLQNRTLSFEVWVPEGASTSSLLESLSRAVPWLLLSEGKDEVSGPPPDDPGVLVEEEP